MRALDVGESPPLLGPSARPLEVTAVMAEPVVGWHHQPTLDGPLSYGAFVQYVAEHGNDLPPMTAQSCVDFELPLEPWFAKATAEVNPLVITSAGEVWGWQSSRSEFADGAVRTRVEVRRKPATEQMSAWSTANRHHIGTGPLKARNATLPAVFTQAITWQVVGIQARIEALLAHVTHLGKLHGHGYGKVKEWNITPGRSDGWQNRLMPDPLGDLHPVRAPHHHRSRLVPCR